MNTDNRTNGQIVAKALVAHCEDHKMPFPRGSVKKIVEALRVAGRLAGEPTEAQVEAAAKALRADEGFMEEVHSALEVSWSEYIARLVLMAAQGAAPQAEIHEPSHDRVYCVRCGGNWPCQPAPALPSSGVDEDALARLLCEKNYLSPDGKPTCAACRDKAHEVAEWLKEQGRA